MNCPTHWKENSIPTSSEEVYQWTGLYDSENVEIYEGDEFSYDGKIWCVEWGYWSHVIKNTEVGPDGGEVVSIKPLTAVVSMLGAVV